MHHAGWVVASHVKTFIADVGNLRCEVAAARTSVKAEYANPKDFLIQVIYEFISLTLPREGSAYWGETIWWWGSDTIWDR
jgi:hypothetical protein